MAEVPVPRDANFRAKVVSPDANPAADTVAARRSLESAQLQAVSSPEKAKSAALASPVASRSEHATAASGLVIAARPTRYEQAGMQLREGKKDAGGQSRLPEGVTISLDKNSQEVLTNPDWQEEESFQVTRGIQLEAQKEGTLYGILSAELIIDKEVVDNTMKEKDRYVYGGRIKVQGENDPANSPTEVGEVASEDMRNQGIGSSLLDELENHARSFGASRIEAKVIKTDKNNTPGLLDFYRKRGFEITLLDQDLETYRIVKWLQDEHPLPEESAEPSPHATQQIKDRENTSEDTVIYTGKRSGRVFITGELVGAGYHANVFSAKEHGQEYAIKLPISPFDDSDLEDFTRQAGYQGSFNHPYITPLELFDISKDLSNRTEVPFIVMPMAESTLEQAIDSSPLSIEEVLRVSEHTSSAVAALHEKGLLYHGLDLDDILLFRDSQGLPVWKLTDLGEAKPIEKERKTARDAYNLDPIGYFEDPPISEQYDWAANLIYPAVTGNRIDFDTERPSFASLIGEENMTVLHHALESVVARAMQEDPADRYPSMAALVKDLHEKIAKAREEQEKLT